MAKAASLKIKLLSTADTGYFYVTKKNARTKTEKLAFKKYDPVARKHVEFKEVEDQVMLEFRSSHRGGRPGRPFSSDAVGHATPPRRTAAGGFRAWAASASWRRPRPER